MRKEKVYLYLTPAERELAIAIVAMVWFRNKVVRNGIDPVDVDRVVGKVMR